MKFKFDFSKLKIKPNLATKKINLSTIKALSISKREFILIGLLMLALEGYILLNFLLIPKWQQLSALQTHNNNQQTLAMNLEKDNAKKGQFQEEIKLLDYKLDKLTKELPPNVAQEDIIINLNKFANDRKLMINGIAFSDISTVSKEDFIAGKTGQAQNAGTGNSAAKASNTSTTSAKIVGGIVLTEEISISFTGNYGALYNFMSDLEKSNRKIITKDITMTRGNENTLKGEIRVQYVGYKGQEDTGVFQLETPLIIGKSSPFLAYLGFEEKAATGTVSQGTSAAPVQVKTYDPNFYLILNTYEDNAPKVIMGDYTKTGTELYSNTNDTVKGKLIVSGNMDKMTYSYSIGGATQTKDAKLRMDGGKLRLDVISQPRKNTSDKVEITLDIDNKTDYPLEVKVINDDKNAPRFNIGTKSGSVLMK